MSVGKYHPNVRISNYFQKGLWYFESITRVALPPAGPNEAAFYQLYLLFA